MVCLVVVVFFFNKISEHMESTVVLHRLSIKETEAIAKLKPTTKVAFTVQDRNIEIKTSNII